MTDGSLPGITRGRPRRRYPTQWPAQWLGVAVVAAGVAAATVLIPPLITPHGATPGGSESGNAPQPARGAATATAAPSAGAATGSVTGSGTATSAAERFTPIVVEAEDPGNQLTGGAAVTVCATCHGGARVRYLCFSCTLVVHAVLPTAGQRTVTVGYEVDGPRSVKVSVNGAPAHTWQVTGPEWTAPRSFQFTAELPAGQLRLSVYNDDTPAPDIDVVTIS